MRSSRLLLCGFLAAALVVGIGATVRLSAQESAGGLRVVDGLHLTVVGHVRGARELAALPNGDLLVGTSGSTVDLLPLPGSSVQSPHAFVSIADPPDSGVAYSAAQHAIFIAGGHGVYRISYRDGDRQARDAPVKIASVRSGEAPPGSDGDVHPTTSVAFSDASGLLYVSIGSSCNACTEIDPTRATIERMTADGDRMTTRAKRIRNGIALAIDPLGGDLWVGDAGQDALPVGHPYEFLDDVSAHAGIADYGWPACEENRVAYVRGADCTNTVVPLVEFPAYSTLIGIAFYPKNPAGASALPVKYRGGIFVTRHGSWHTPGGCNVAPEVDFVPMHDRLPAVPVDWNDPRKQWQPFVTGFQPGCSASSRIGRPTGIAVLPDGALVIGDDRSGAIYRIAP